MRAWELTVKGIISAGEAEAERLEQRLAEELHAVVSKAEYGAHYSVLGTPSVHGSVHTPQTPTQPAATAAPAPADTASVAGFDPEKLAQLAEFAQSLGLNIPGFTPTPQEAPAQQ